MRKPLILFTLSWLVAFATSAAHAEFSAQRFAQSNLLKVAALLDQKGVAYERTPESLRFVDTLESDRASDLYGRKVEVFGNLIMRFEGGGKSGWAIARNNQVETLPFTDQPDVEAFLTQHTRALDRVTTSRPPLPAGGAVASAFLFEARRPTSPTGAVEAGGLLITRDRNGAQHVEAETAEGMRQYHAALARASGGGLSDAILAQSIRTTGQHMHTLFQMQHHLGSFNH